jgi:hypothetical protein
LGNFGANGRNVVMAWFSHFEVSTETLKVLNFPASKKSTQNTPKPHYRWARGAFS